MAIKALEVFLGKIGLATSLLNGLMPKTDKAKLDETEDYVIDTWIATDKLSYYKKYKSGLVIQGGYKDSPTSGNLNTTITFPVALSNTPAKVLVRELGGQVATALSYEMSRTYSVSSTGFSFSQRANSENPELGYYWEAIGYLAPA